MCFDGGALARAQYPRANFRISPELFIFFLELARSSPLKASYWLISILHSDHFKRKSFLKLFKKYIFSEGEQFPLTRAGPLLGAERAGPGGGGCLNTPPSNSAPGPCSDMR